MAFLAQLAASEDLTYHRSYSKEFVYADLYNERPTKITCTNSDLGFSGATTALRLKYKSKLNFEGKYAVFWTSGYKSDKEKLALDTRYPNPKEHEFIAMLPMADFLKMFSEPKDLHKFFEDKANLVCSHWNQLNSGPEMVGKRKPVGANYTLAKNEWRPAKNPRLEERSVYNLEISSYAATFKHMQDQEFLIGPQHLKVHIKLRSTTTKDYPDTSSELEGMSYDSYGYSCNALHFLGLLSDPAFADFVKEVAEVNASYSNAEKAGTAIGRKRARTEEVNSFPGGAAAPGGEYQAPSQSDD